MQDQLPILYSFRRCPYAMRARMGLAYAQIKCELREVILRDKPSEMIALSEKATVPVLQLPDGQIIDESYDIIKWAISQNDPLNWQEFLSETDVFVQENDGSFKTALDKYKYASRFPEQSPEFYRDQGAVFLNKLNDILNHQPYLLGHHHSVADIALFPFIRQFAHVDRDWFYNTPYSAVQNWLTTLLNSEIFTSIMTKYSRWEKGNNTVYFPDINQGIHSSLAHSENSDTIE